MCHPSVFKDGRCRRFYFKQRHQYSLDGDVLVTALAGDVIGFFQYFAGIIAQVGFTTTYPRQFL